MTQMERVEALTPNASLQCSGSLVSDGGDLDEHLKTWRREFEKRKQSRLCDEVLSPPRIWSSRQSASNCERLEQHQPQSQPLQTQQPQYLHQPQSLRLPSPPQSPFSRAPETLGQLSQLSTSLGIGTSASSRAYADFGDQERGSIAFGLGGRHFSWGTSDAAFGSGSILDDRGHQFASDQGKPNQADHIEELRALQKSIAEHERELRELEHVHNNGVVAIQTCASAVLEDDEHLRNAEPETRLLDDSMVEIDSLVEELAKVDAYVASLEDTLRRGGVTEIGEPGFLAGRGFTRDVDMCLTAGTKVSYTCDALEAKAKALEREIRMESAVALECQDHIHWLRLQLRRQAEPGIATIVDMMERLKIAVSGRADLVNSNCKAAVAPNSGKVEAAFRPSRAI